MRLPQQRTVGIFQEQASYANTPHTQSAPAQKTRGTRRLSGRNIPGRANIRDGVWWVRSIDRALAGNLQFGFTMGCAVTDCTPPVCVRLLVDC